MDDSAQQRVDGSRAAWWTGRWPVLAVALLVAGITVTVVVVIQRSTSVDFGAAGPSQSPGVPVSGSASADPSPPAAPPSRVATASTAAPPSRTAASPPTAPSPPTVTWEERAQLRLPVSGSAGPRVLTDTTSAGFARTPEGALIAAVHISRRLGSGTTDAARAAHIEEHFLPGAHRDLLVARFTGPDYASSPKGVPNPLVGYVHRSYTAEEAVISLVVGNAGVGSGTVPYYAITYTLRWRDGDWKMEAPPGGSLMSISAPLDTPMVSWPER
jgi:hypothetical protein